MWNGQSPPHPVHYAVHQWDPGVFYISVSTPQEEAGVSCFDTCSVHSYRLDIRMETGRLPAAQSPRVPLAVRVQHPPMPHQGGKWPAEGLPASIDRKCKGAWRGCWEDQDHPLMSPGLLSPRKGPSILLADHSQGHRG